MRPYPQDLYDLIDDDDEEEKPTLVYPGHPSSVRKIVPWRSPRVVIARRPRRRGLLLRAMLILSAVAIVFVLGCWLGSRHGLPTIAVDLAPAAPARARTAAQKATRVLDPPTEPLASAEPARAVPSL